MAVRVGAGRHEGVDLDALAADVPDEVAGDGGCGDDGDPAAAWPAIGVTAAESGQGGREDQHEEGRDAHRRRRIQK
jgi:hypothetical protein